MKIYEETNLSNFDFWSSGANNAQLLTNEQLDAVGEVLADYYPDGMTTTEINDLFWYNFDYVCALIGLTPKDVGKDE